jgi:hypothetical protein
MTFSNEIQQTKEDIALLQEKLEKLEELEEFNSFTLAERAYKKRYGHKPYPCGKWDIFEPAYNVGYNDGMENNKNFEPTPQEQENNEWRNVALRFGEELVSIGPCGYYDMTAGDWLEWAKGAYEKNSDDLLKLVLKKQRKYEALTKKLQEKTVIEPTPQTPEQVEQGLRDAMKKAKEDGVFDEPKPPTLLDIVYEWCDDDNDLPCEELVNRIKKWLSDEIEYEYGDGDYDKGWNDALCTIKEKLR